MSFKQKILLCDGYMYNNLDLIASVWLCSSAYWYLSHLKIKGVFESLKRAPKNANVDTEYKIAHDFEQSIFLSHEGIL